MNACHACHARFMLLYPDWHVDVDQSEEEEGLERVDACRERGHDIKMIPLYEGLVHFGLKIPFVLEQEDHTTYLAWKAGRVRR